jgi:hypothetical protein
MLGLKPKSKPVEPPFFPAGTFVRTENGYFYIYSSDKRYRVVSTRVLNTWNPHRVVTTTEAAVRKYRIAAKLRCRNGSLIWNIADGKIYLIEGGKRRWVKSPDWFEHLGLTPSDLAWNMQCVTHVSQEEVNLHPLGEDLD